MIFTFSDDRKTLFEERSEGASRSWQESKHGISAIYFSWGPNREVPINLTQGASRGRKTAGLNTGLNVKCAQLLSGKLFQRDPLES